MTTPLATIAHLDFTPTVPCEWDRHGTCHQPATHRLTIAVLDDTAHPIAQLNNHLCTAHRDTTIRHLDTCPNCPQLLRVVSLEEIG